MSAITTIFMSGYGTSFILQRIPYFKRATFCCLNRRFPCCLCSATTIISIPSYPLFPCLAFLTHPISWASCWRFVHIVRSSQAPVRLFVYLCMHAFVDSMCSVCVCLSLSSICAIKRGTTAARSHAALPSSLHTAPAPLTAEFFFFVLHACDDRSH